jgi:hypothetical protein
MSTDSTITIMTADVVDGWQKLPNELKLIILRYALPSGETFGWLSFNKTQLHQTYSQYTNGCKTPSTSLIACMVEVRRCETNVLPLMACPVIGALIPEAFYTQNVFKILILPGEVSSEVVLPPVLVGKAMRHVKIGVQCPLYGLHTLKLLATCARRLLNLHTLVVEITGSDATTEELETVEPIQFSAKEMCVTYKHSTAAAGQEWILDPNEMRVLEKLIVAS